MTVEPKSQLRSLKQAVAAALLACALTSSSAASLGGSAESVEADQARMKARIETTHAGRYTVHVITGPNRVVVREYVSESGQVFGLSWRGPFVPDLRQILGSYFERYAKASRMEQNRDPGQRTLRIRESELVVETAGHMRAYFGKAYDPRLVPAGVNVNEIQ